MLPSSSPPLPKSIDNLVAVHAYEGRAMEAVKRLKFGRATALAAPMSRAIFEASQHLLIDVAVPVPIHWTRRLNRGFNQAELLAEAFPHRSTECLSRVRRTGTQRGREREARLANVRGAFQARDVAGLRVLLVDDVSASGGTLTACAEALRAAGAVWVGAALFSIAGD